MEGADYYRERHPKGNGGAAEMKYPVSDEFPMLVVSLILLAALTWYHY